MKKALFVFGTRPEAIKMAPVIIKMKEAGAYDVKVCVTSQHRQMLDQVLDIFGIEPDYDLDVMRPNQTLFDVTASILSKLREVMEKERPDIVLVQGDTTTAFVAALAGFYSRLNVAHIEAGLRTYDKYSPFPEEMNRKLITSIADIHLAPTDIAKENLVKEMVPDNLISVTGNTSIDALFITLDSIRSGKVRTEIMDKIGLKNEKYILVTAHRRESFGKGFENICNALLEIANKNEDFDLVYPVHLNPNVQDPVKRILSGNERIHLIDPLDYVSFVSVMNGAYLILTDSGGVQEEAPSLGKPTLVLRDTTERMEAIDAGTAVLVGTDKDRIMSETQKLISDNSEYSKFQKIENPYGDGNASEKIIKAITDFLDRKA